MNIPVERPDCHQAFIAARQDRSVRLLVFHGPGGVGKSTLMEALSKETFLENRHCVCDLRRLYPGISPDMVGSLYNLCDSVEQAKLAEFVHFDLAQQVFAAKTGQPPRVLEHSGLGWDVADCAEGLLSTVSAFPGLGSGVQAFRLAYRAYKKIRPYSPREQMLLEQYRAMQADELAQEMPAALALDVEKSSTPTKGRRVIFLDNLDAHSPSGWAWLRSLIEATPSILWVAFSRGSLSWKDPWIRKADVEPFTPAQCKCFWDARLPNAPPSDLAAMDEHSEGIPFHMDLLYWEYKRQGSVGDWLLGASSQRLVERLVAGLTADQHEIVHLLSAVRRFDPPLFRALFPGHSFWAYEEWFRGFLFEPVEVSNKETAFTVRKLYAECILAGCSEALRQEYHQRIFDYYSNLLAGLALQNTESQLVKETAFYFAEFCHHGKLCGTARTYITQLVGISNFLIRAGQGPSLLDEFQFLADSKFAENQCGAWGALCCLDQVARLSLIRGLYAEAESAIDHGLRLSREDDAWLLPHLRFLAQRTQLCAAYPPADPALTLDAGLRYLAEIQAQSHRLVAADAARYEMDALSFLGKQYLTRGMEEEAMEFFTQGIKIAEDPRKAQAYNLYGALAPVQERLGELLATQGAQSDARSRYKAALESYKAAEYTNAFIDCEQTLNHGLAHKRMAESDFQQGDIEAGIQQLKAALEQYDTVAAVSPEVVDLYCKIGWACMCGAEALLALPDWKTLWFLQIEDYLNQVQKAVRTGRDWEQNFTANPNPVQAGSRQLDNLLSAEGRSRGALLEGLGRMEAAEEALHGSVQRAREAVEHTPSHPYSHSGLAESCLVLARFLVRQGQNPGIAAQDGLLAIDRALLLTPGERRFTVLRQELAELASPEEASAALTV